MTPAETARARRHAERVLAIATAPSSAPARLLAADLVRACDELGRLRAMVAGLAERVADQSELLSNRAERTP